MIIIIYFKGLKNMDKNDSMDDSLDDSGDKREEEEKEEWDQKYNCICYINSNCCEHFARISQKERNKKREEGEKNNI